jgi:hypothetical protein
MAQSWVSLSDQQTELLAPAHSFETGDALLGSIGRRSKDVRYFLESEEAIVDRERALALIRRSIDLGPSISYLLGGNIVDELCQIRGIGCAFATRLLTIARPDCFIVLNNKSKDWLQKATGLSLAGKGRSYTELLRWLSRQQWFRAPTPRDETERRIWNIRAALLDAFAYEPT